MGYDNLSGKMVPNTEITDDPSKIFTASFASGKNTVQRFLHGRGPVGQFGCHGFGRVKNQP
jgi:hypothetical protein